MFYRFDVFTTNVVCCRRVEHTKLTSSEVRSEKYHPHPRCLGGRFGLEGRLLGFVPREPPVKVVGPQDDWHAVVNCRGQFVRLRRNDRVADQSAAVRLLPCVP